MTENRPVIKLDSKDENKKIQVYVRFRNKLKKEEKEKMGGWIFPKENNVMMKKDKKMNYYFDRILKPETTQSEFYNEIGPQILDELIKGYNCTIMAYGQTGCLDPETEVIMFDGQIKKVKNIVIGDELMGDDGKPRKVLKLFSGMDDMYKIIHPFGSYVVNQSHVLTLEDKKTREIKDIHLKEYLKMDKNQRDNLQTVYFSEETARNTEFGYFGNFEERLSLLKSIFETIDVEHDKEYWMSDFFFSENNMDADSFLFLCRSLGLYCLKTIIQKRQKNDGIFKLMDQVRVYLSEMLVDEKKTPKKKMKKFSSFPTKVKYLKRGQYNGFLLDGNHRFLMADFVVTHNSGKTFTMIGNDEESDEQIGIVPRILSELFERTKNRECWIESSYFQIYNENIIDLLSNDQKSLKVMMTNIKECTIKRPTTYHEIMQDIKSSEKRRITAKTNMNEHSSRSHSVFMIKLIQCIENGVLLKSKLFLVDLAGSEKVSKSGVKGKELKQAGYINKSLSTLSNVINALTTKPRPKHIPYRDSKLTRLLSDSLGGNSKTIMILNCSPIESSIPETKSTLDFGVRAKMVENKAEINKTVTLEELQKEYDELKEKYNILLLNSSNGGHLSSGVLLSDNIETPKSQRPIGQIVSPKKYEVDEKDLDQINDSFRKIFCSTPTSIFSEKQSDTDLDLEDLSDLEDFEDDNNHHHHLKKTYNINLDDFVCDDF